MELKIVESSVVSEKALFVKLKTYQVPNGMCCFFAYGTLWLRFSSMNINVYLCEKGNAPKAHQNLTCACCMIMFRNFHKNHNSYSCHNFHPLRKLLQNPKGKLFKNLRNIIKYIFLKTMCNKIIHTKLSFFKFLHIKARSNYIFDPYSFIIRICLRI